MKSNVLTIANKFSFRKGDVKDYEEKSDRFSSRGRQKLQLKQVLSLISFPLSLSLMRIGEAKWRGIRKYICRDGFIRVGFDSLMAFVPLPREISNRAEICRCKTETYSAISCNNDNAPISRQPSPPVTSYYSGLDIVNPQKQRLSLSISLDPAASTRVTLLKRGEDMTEEEEENVWLSGIRIDVYPFVPLLVIPEETASDFNSAYSLQSFRVNLASLFFISTSEW